MILYFTDNFPSISQTEGFGLALRTNLVGNVLLKRPAVALIGIRSCAQHSYAIILMLVNGCYNIQSELVLLCMHGKTKISLLYDRNLSPVLFCWSSSLTRQSPFGF